MTQYSSDEDEDGNAHRPVAPTQKKSTGGAAFAEVVRAARLKAKEDEQEDVTAAKTV